MFSFKKWLFFTKKTEHKTIKKSLLSGFPQKKGICRRVFWLAPKKPNSARRKVARAFSVSLKQAVNLYIPGEGHNLQVFSVVLFRGGRVQDLPGINYKVIRGAYDCQGVLKRSTSRSRYGTKRLKKVKTTLSAR